MTFEFMYSVQIHRVPRMHAFCICIYAHAILATSCESFQINTPLSDIMCFRLHGGRSADRLACFQSVAFTRAHEQIVLYYFNGLLASAGNLSIYRFVYRIRKQTSLVIAFPNKERKFFENKFWNWIFIDWNLIAWEIRWWSEWINFC